MHEFNQAIKNFLDIVATLVAGATFAKLLSFVAAILPIVWFCIRIHDRIKYGPTKNENED